MCRFLRIQPYVNDADITAEIKLGSMRRGIFVAIAPKDNFLLGKCQHLMARKMMKSNRPSTLDIVN